MKKQLPIIEEDLTPQEVMKMKSFSLFTVEQATELLSVYDVFCEVAFKIISREEKNAVEEIA